MNCKLIPISRIVCAAFAAAALAPAAQAAGTVKVNFVKPEQFADVRDRAFTREQHLAALERVLVETASPHVADGQTLTLIVTDVDLAGEPRFGVRAHDVRVLRGRADWPRITLQWTLDAPGRAARSGRAVVQDMAYLQRLPTMMLDGTLPYERRMLEAWFKGEFGAS